MLVEIDQETLDRMFKQTLVKDWELIKKEIKTLKHKSILLDHHKEELKFMKKTKKSYERVIRYCYSNDEANEILGVE